MIQRHKRFDMPSRPAAVLADLKTCRDAMIVLHRDLTPGEAAYKAAAGVVAAIDAFAGVLTGDARHFALKPARSLYGGEAAAAPGEPERQG